MMPLPVLSALVRPLRWSGALLLLALAADPRSPYLLPLRAHITLLLIAGGLALAAIVLQAVCRGRLGRFEGALLTAVALGSAAQAGIETGRFETRRDAVLTAGAADDALVRAVGARFMVGYRNAGEVAVLAEHGLIGGIYLGQRNVRGRSIAAIRAEIDHLQRLRQRAGLPPLIVAADQEGGSVAHMTPPLEALPALSSLLDGDTDTLEARARAYGARQGASLARLGVTLNFGPVVDLLPAGSGPLLDTHTRTAERAIGADPALVGRVARAYGEGLAEAGVQATLKHFPGLGGVAADTHHFRARLDTPPAQLALHDWQPFRAAASSSAAIMLGHVVLPELDPQRPASLSPAIARDLLRRQWNYRGLLITDDLNMGAVYRRSICRAAVEALHAGVDLVLISYDPDQFYPAMHCALAAARAGQLTMPDARVAAVDKTVDRL